MLCKDPTLLHPNPKRLATSLELNNYYFQCCFRLGLRIFPFIFQEKLVHNFLCQLSRIGIYSESKSHTTSHVTSSWCLHLLLGTRQHSVSFSYDPFMRLLLQLCLWNLLIFSMHQIKF